MLHVDQAFLGAWLTNSRGLDDLVRARHLHLRLLERQLIAPWRGRVSSAQIKVLLERTDWTFTQHHLAVHMFFHFYHLDVVNGALPAILGIDWPTASALEGHGLSLTDIAVRDGRTPAQVISRLHQVIYKAAMAGIRERAVLRDQEMSWLTFDLNGLPGWLNWHLPTVSAASRRFSPSGPRATSVAVPAVGFGVVGGHLFCTI